MTKKQKTLLATCLVLPATIGSVCVLTSCSNTHPFVKPSPVNINSYISDINEVLTSVNDQLNEMDNFNNLFKLQTDILNNLKEINDNFKNTLSSVIIDITPNINANNQLEYKFKYEIYFRNDAEWILNDNNDFIRNANKLISKKEFVLNNPLLTQNQQKICFWITNANVCNGKSYSAIEVDANSFIFSYNDESYNITKNKNINAKISNFNQIEIYMNNVINNAQGQQWFSVSEKGILENPENPAKTDINVNIKYNNKNSTQLISTDNPGIISSNNFIVNAVQNV